MTPERKTLTPPPRKLERGERWDFQLGRFLAEGEQATGTIRKVVNEDYGTCYKCGREMDGEEVDEDLGYVHVPCGGEWWKEAL